MSTGYLIGMLGADGFIRSIYCGSPPASDAASLLTTYYRELPKIEALLACGDLIRLERAPAKAKDTKKSVAVKLPKDGEEPDYGVFRDKRQYALEGGQLYPKAHHGFLWQDGKWSFTYFDSRDGKYHPLS